MEGDLDDRAAQQDRRFTVRGITSSTTFFPAAAAGTSPVK
jgi:hypothetical protein